MSSARTKKEGIYDAEISPLMTKIINICKENGINMAATFSLDHDEAVGETLFCTSIFAIDREDKVGYRRVNDCYAIMYPEAAFLAMTIRAKGTA
jgi:hypothetical protein